MRSLQPLAQLAARESAASGYAIYTVDPVTDARTVTLAWGAPVPDSTDSGYTVDLFPLRAGEAVTGIVAFVFRGSTIAPSSRAVLDRIAHVIEHVWRLSLIPGAYAQSAARIAELENELADSKIADRVLGLLANGAVPRDAIDIIVSHAESVLRPGQLATVLEQLTQEMEQDLAERELTNRAKAVLQRRYGMSEDQAHVHLRLVSRKSRKRLRDVARDLLQETAVSGR
jgi:ANTAR domain